MAKLINSVNAPFKGFNAVISTENHNLFRNSDSRAAGNIFRISLTYRSGENNLYF
jgi:hypothetical protein